jgi:hypothetical protein
VVLLTVRVSDWELESSARVLNVDDEHRCWLTFQEVEPSASSEAGIAVIRGVAVALPTWPGQEFGRHPVRIDVDNGAFYWDAPEPVTGEVEVRGTVSTNDVDAPDGFPETTGVIRRLRMVWHDVVMGPQGKWIWTSEGPRHEEVASTYLPAHERWPPVRTPRETAPDTKETWWTGVLMDLETVDEAQR